MEESKDDPAKDQDPGKLVAENIPGYNEEKDVPYRKYEPSSAEVDLDDNANSISDFGQNRSDTSSKIDEQHTEIKRVFGELMDAQPSVNVGIVTFTWFKEGDMTFKLTAAKPVE